MAENAVRLGGCLCRGARGIKACDQACKRNRISGGERDDALPQRLLREGAVQSPSSVPADSTKTKNNVNAGKFPGQRENQSGHPGAPRHAGLNPDRESERAGGRLADHDGGKFVTGLLTFVTDIVT